jgi:transposase InsO family protein
MADPTIPAGHRDGVAVLEAHSAQAAGLLTERTRRHLAAAQRRQAPHIQATQPGELVCVDTFYVGKLKGVGKAWQYTACDAACSFAVAQLSLEFSAEAAARFLTGRVLPTFQAAGWPRQRILPEGHRDGVSDQGNEYRGAFDKACAQRGIRRTRTKPRHAWTNGLVERLQGTILSELWRTPALRRTQCGASVEFRRRFFTSAAAMQTALDRYLDFYNHRRSHQGYRTRGRTPGEIFFTRGGRNDKRRRRQSVNTYPV